jgi:lysophospholipase L1-like esterase
MSTLPALIVCLVLGGCGGGGDAAPCPQTVRVQLFGDSTMWGTDGATGQQALHPPAARLQVEMDARFGAGKVSVSSRAKGGTTARQLVEGTDGVNQPWPGSVNAEIVVINHGINDMQAHETQGEYLGWLTKLAANTAGATLVFETPNKVKSWDVGPYADTMRQFAASQGLTLADTYTITDTSMLGDWAHPTDLSYAFIVSQSLAPAVSAAITQRCALK